MRRRETLKRYFSGFAASLVAVLLALAPLTFEAREKPTPPPPSTPVTSTIYDRDPVSGDLLLFRSDHYNAIDKATYANSIGTAWSLLLFNQSVRWVWVSLSRPLPGSPLNPAPDGFYYEKVEIYSRCWDANNQEIGFRTIPSGTSMNRCSFGFDFEYNRTKYKLVMQPVIPGLLNTVGTGWATVSCNAASGTTCVNWTIAPNMIAGNGNVPTVANLYRFANNGSLVLVGQYYNTYRIDVTNP